MSTPPRFTQLLRRPSLLLAFGFGAGLAPRAPGTFGSLLGVLLWWPLASLSWQWYLVVLTTACVLGIWLCGTSTRQLGVHDHPGIVWDEIVGVWVTFFSIPLEIAWIVLGFALFRLLDIVKPWPIRLLDQRLRGGLGIMADDLLAGLLALALLHAIMHVWGLL